MPHFHRDYQGANFRPFREAIEAIENEIGVPIRVLNAAYAVTPPTGGRTGAEGWTTAQAEACGVTREDARETGVTVNINGIPVPEYAHVHVNICDANANGDRTGTMWYDVQAPRDDAALDILNITTVNAGDDGETPWLEWYDEGRRANHPEVPLLWFADRWVCTPLSPGWNPLTNGGNAGRTYAEYGWPRLYERFMEAMGNAIRTAAGQLDPEMAERMMERHRARFAELFEFAMNDQIPAARQQVANLLGQHQNAIAEMERIGKQLTEQRNHLDALVLVAAGEATGAIGDPQTAWQQLLDHPKIESVRLAGNNLIVTTTELTMTEATSGRSAVVGAFQVNINLNDGKISPRNLTGRRGTHDHPHIFNGNFCVYQLRRTFEQLARRRELLALVELVIASLETVNIDDDWGRYSALWFEDTENRELLLTGEAGVGTPA